MYLPRLIELLLLDPNAPNGYLLFDLFLFLRLLTISNITYPRPSRICLSPVVLWTHTHDNNIQTFEVKTNQLAPFTF
uniref:Uncharacterized protein n=1 Tax=Aegilops tauschii subsp. strangulata TaxID=200361 RepID=A0A453MJW0_AEGTS